MTVQPSPASRLPSRVASSCRGSPGPIRAEPSTAISTGIAGIAPSACDELVATDALLRRHRHDDPAEHALAVLAARVERQRPADPCLTTGLMNVTVQAQHGLEPGQGQPHGRAPD